MGINSKAEVRRRVADIYGLVVDGLPLGQICRYVAANCSWHASDRTICRYIARAREIMLEQAKVGRKEIFAESLARKQRLYARASAGGQLKTALAVQNSIDRMFGDFAGDQDLSAIDEYLAMMKGERPSDDRG